MSRFPNKITLVTGAGSGIGRTTAQAFAAEGAVVIVSDISVEQGEATTDAIKEAGGQATFIHCDVADPEQIATLTASIVAEFGRLDIAINNAGVGGTIAKTADVPMEEYYHTVGVNLGGVFFGMQHQLRQMLAQGGGSIVNVASVAGLRALPHSSVYTATKHAVVGLTKAAAVEYARKNIRINAVCPVFTRSAMFDSMFTIDPTLEEKLKRNIPLGRYGQPEDIAQAILWLCAPENTFVTGLALPLDGGMTAT
jgi:NAD(P)-dependent dehydrogenase (short-subunit alcohol dehydrogenase family)